MMNAIPQFTDAHATFLHRFLTAPERPEGTMTYPQLAGFVFAVACAPELVRPSEWLPLVFDDQEPDYETMDEAQDVVAAMMALYNECNRQGVEARAALPPGCEIRSKPLDNLTTTRRSASGRAGSRRATGTFKRHGTSTCQPNSTRSWARS